MTYYLIKQKRTAAFSPDINIIELVWADLKQYLRKKKYSTLEEWVKGVRRFEQKLTPEYCRRYTMHEKEVLKAVIKKRGNWSKINKNI